MYRAVPCHALSLHLAVQFSLFFTFIRYNDEKTPTTYKTFLSFNSSNCYCIQVVVVVFFSFRAHKSGTHKSKLTISFYFPYFDFMCSESNIPLKYIYDQITMRNGFGLNVFKGKKKPRCAYIYRNEADS